MPELYFEDIHKADKEYPYIDLLIANLNYIAHYHEEIEVIYIIEGKIEINVNGAETVLCEGDIYIIMPGEIHGYISETENKVYIMKFSVPHEFSYLKIYGKISVGDSYYKAFKNIVEIIALEDTAKNDGYQFAVNMQANALLLEIIRTLKPKKISESARREIIKKAEFLNCVNEYIEKHYSEKIKLETIAAQLHYSKFYFSHIFKETVQMSFIEYLTIFRLEKAKRGLMSGKMVTEIALDCGFNNLRSLNRSFKKYYSVSPLKFRHCGK